MFPREFHIWDLPQDKIFIDVQDTFRKKLIEQAKQKFGRVKNIANFLGVRKNNIWLWKNGVSEWKGKISRRYVPLDYFLKICDSVNNRDLSKEMLEKNVISFRGKGNGKTIKTIFPWKEDERIIRILFHIIGDGYGSCYGKKNDKGKFTGNSYYRNTRIELREEFRNDLSFFGEVPVRLNIDMLCFPKIIPQILKNLYGIEFDTYNSRVPNILYNLPKELVAQGIKAYADDEGSFDDCRVKFTSFNRNLLEGIINLIKVKFPEIKENISEIAECKTILNNKHYIGYRFSILSKGLNFYYNYINFAHSKKKKLLENWVIRNNRNWDHKPRNETKLQILELLSEGPQTIKLLSEKLDITENTIRGHINGSKNGILSLSKQDLIFRNDKFIEITSKGLELLNSR